MGHWIINQAKASIPDGQGGTIDFYSNIVRVWVNTPSVPSGTKDLKRWREYHRWYWKRYSYAV